MKTMNPWLNLVLTVIACCAVLIVSDVLIALVYALTGWFSLAAALGVAFMGFSLTVVQFWGDWKLAMVWVGAGFVFGFLYGFTHVAP